MKKHTEALGVVLPQEKSGEATRNKRYHEDFAIELITS